MVRFGLVFLCLLLSSFTAPQPKAAPSSTELHPYFVSIYQLTYSPEHHALQITAKIFTDNLEKGLMEAGYPKVKLATKDELEKTDQYIEEWMRKRFSIKVDSEAVSWKFLGKEAEINATWLYMEVTGVDRPHSVTVKNTALLDVYDTQTNMTHVEVGDETKTILIRGNEYSGTVTFE
jgi:hypothetical protein